MASREDIEATYDYMDEFWRASLGDHADITCAMYDGDGSLSLEEAQHRKHRYILGGTRFTSGARVLDVGCGWGGLLMAVREAGGSGVGLTLSSAQAAACRKAGLDVHVLDWRDPAAEDLGVFDIVASVGAFEHFCSEEDYIEGRQEACYRRFFEFCSRRLRPGSRLFLQTMTWGASVPDPTAIRLDAPRGTDNYVLAVLRLFYPGSWLPTGAEQVARAASRWFVRISAKNGRHDYILTMRQWDVGLRRMTLRKLRPAARLLRHAVSDPSFFRRLEVIRGNYNLRCFERNVMSHERMIFERAG